MSLISVILALYWDTLDKRIVLSFWWELLVNIHRRANCFPHTVAMDDLCLEEAIKRK